MSYNVSRDEITVAGTTYDIDREHGDGLSVYLTIEEFPGLKGELYNEQYIEGWMSPRDWCNVGTMLVNYQGYNLGDDTLSEDFNVVDCEECSGSGFASDDWDDNTSCPKCKGDGQLILDPVDFFRKEHGARVVMPLFVYEHSGITIRAGGPLKSTTPADVESKGRFMGDDAGWDTSFVGFVFDTPEQVKEYIGEDATDEQIVACLNDEVEVYASYLEGDVTGYNVEDDETDFQEGCGGFVGDSDECERQCFDDMESAIEKRLAEIKERADMAARDIITV